MRAFHRLLPPLLLLAGCVAPPPAPPPPAPPPAPEPTASEAGGTDWRDRPLTAGSWRYGGGAARFGPPGEPPVIELRCDPAAGGVTLARPQATAGTTAFAVTTSYGVSRLPVTVAPDGSAVARLAANDPTLDRIAFSRGRILIAGGGPELILPAWAEPGRVVEDCRTSPP